MCQVCFLIPSYVSGCSEAKATLRKSCCSGLFAEQMFVCATSSHAGLLVVVGRAHREMKFYQQFLSSRGLYLLHVLQLRFHGFAVPAVVCMAPRYNRAVTPNGRERAA